jgi:hypothetical protein
MNNNMCEVPVLIAGAGSVGLTIAANLSWRGIPSLVVDPQIGSERASSRHACARHRALSPAAVSGRETVQRKRNRLLGRNNLLSRNKTPRGRDYPPVAPSYDRVHFSDAWYRFSPRCPPHASWTFQYYCVACDVTDHPSFNSSRLSFRYRLG